MTDAEVQLAPLLNDCDREPIHIPQAIQPHGFLLALDTTWYFGNVYNAANGARRVNQNRQKRFFENLDVRYGLVFPPARNGGPMPAIEVGTSF